MSGASIRAALLGVVVLAGGLGCAEEEQAGAPQAAAPTKKAKAKAPSAAPKSAAPAPEQGPGYTPIGKRDPFRSYIADMRELAQAEERRRPESTEKFELDQYRLTGLITGTSQPQAMVEDPEKMGHTLRVNSRLGKNGGRVTRIAVNEIIVTEEFRAPTGELIRVPITLRLRDPELDQLSEQMQ